MVVIIELTREAASLNFGFLFTLKSRAKYIFNKKK